MVIAVQVWSPDDWEAFALGLLQTRHGALNVRKVPAEHKGDWGVDYYCVAERVAYQCFAVTEPIDIATRAERQKEKITTDLRKLIHNGSKIGKLFLGQTIKHWNLLVPLHDSKEVNLHCAKKTTDLRAASCPVLDSDFEVDINDISSFPGHATESMFKLFSKLSLVVRTDSAEVDRWKSGAAPNLLDNLDRKLRKRAKGAPLDEAVSEALKAFLESDTILDALRSRSADLYEKISAALTARSRRLCIAGPQGGSDAGAILHTEIDHLAAAIKNAAPNLSDDNAHQIALGAASAWIMRCPLDFPPYDC